MKKSDIENHKAWKYISSLSNQERYFALTGTNGVMFENAFNVKLEEWAFTRLSEIPDDWVSISVSDSVRNIAFIMVARPK